MKQLIKEAVKSFSRNLVALTERSKMGRYLLDQIVNSAMGQIVEVRHQGINLTFSCPNSLNRWRATTFSTKEPESLEWIDSFEEGAVFWDIGANVGLYSLYAARRKKCHVYAFEPSVFNLELLARNVWLNELTDFITLIPLPLTERQSVRKLNMSSMDWGGALSTFGEEFGHDGKPLSKIFEFRTLGISMQDAVGALGIPRPDYIKMDVDGIEHLILKGGPSVMGRVKQVLIEINEDFPEQAEQSALHLMQAGLALKEKRHAEMVASSAFKSVFNQIWQRPLEQAACVNSPEAEN